MHQPKLIRLQPPHCDKNSYFLLITSFPVLRRIINDNKLCVKYIFYPLSCGFTLSSATVGKTPFDEGLMHMLDAEKVCYLAVVRAVLYDEISAFASFERA